MDNYNITHLQELESHLKELDSQYQVPILRDKALIDLINGIQVNRDLISYGKKQRSLGRLWDLLTGSDSQRQSLLGENLVAGQNTLYQWALELTSSEDISQVALAVTQEKLLEAREAIRRQQQRLNIQHQELRTLLQGLTKEIDSRFQKLDEKINNLEVSTAAHQEFESIITFWEAKSTYTKLPWVVQVAFLARQVFSGAVASYELKSNDKKLYREWFVNRVVKSPRSQEIPDPQMTPHNPFCSLADLLEKTRLDMADNGRTLELAAALLEVRSVPRERLLKTPLLFTIGTTLELAALPPEDIPPKPAHCAIELCRAHIQHIDQTTDRRQFVETIVHETANDCMAIMATRPTITS
ncbi:MAG: hypothetical protein F6K50_15015 [Moorea sp. SIO3I7]|uniref:diguanylate cyclase regulator RdcB family protein n=1 Tax=unclassified Moorena TaxID=2683338 RepID=UPI0013C0DB4B|nr:MULTISPECIES: diguanylate cyclase regulator RdcB family protein [unclassified Moorena]NEN96792.1 hypothetical protein [Moorena sp. SIO3I7]NEO08656.1 hypothetical protein [Moorena sp. SIO3I8]NEP23028.1 hypothetical protein [Moorena sp. SIO3I6]